MIRLSLFYFCILFDECSDLLYILIGLFMEGVRLFINKSNFLDITFLTIFIATCFLYIYKSNKEVRVFVYNKTKDMRIFISKDLPQSKYVVRDTIKAIPQMGNAVVQSVGQVYAVYNQVEQYWGEDDASALKEEMSR